MSVTTSIGCHKCKESLWIGQGEIIYTGEPETMEALKHFLYNHKNHPLEFYGENDFIEFNDKWGQEGYKDFDGKEYIEFYKLSGLQPKRK